MKSKKALYPSIERYEIVSTREAMRISSELIAFCRQPLYVAAVSSARAEK